MNWAQRNRLAFQAKAYAHGWRYYWAMYLRLRIPRPLGQSESGPSRKPSL